LGVEQTHPEVRMRGYLRRVGELAPVLTCVALIAFFSLVGKTFLTQDNILNILQQNSALAIMAVGITFVLLCAEIDLSIAFMATLSGVLAAFLYVFLGKVSPGLPEVLRQGIPILAALAVTGLLGWVSGFCTAWLGLPSFMVTLAMMLITKGLALRITKGAPIFDIPSLLKEAGTGSLTLLTVKVPYIFLLATVFLLAGFLVLRYTRFGRYVYMSGGNRQAAELAGINVRMVTSACLCICGLTAGISGIVLIGRMGSAQAEGLDGMLIDCISAVVLGGTSLFGGRGGIANTVVGLLTLGVLHNGLNHIDINIYMKEFISGVILLGALVLNVAMSKMKSTN
jgi:ribose transport system permease protein